MLLSGIGYSFIFLSQKIIQQKIENYFSTFDFFWIGIFIVIAIFQVWSFFYPLNNLSLVFFITLALINLKAILSFYSRRFVGYCKSSPLGYSIVFLFISSALVIISATGVSTLNWNGAAYDTDLYHFNWIRWANEFPVIPGIANLHSRLGVNSGFLTFAAIVDNAWWDRSSAWIVYGLFITVFAVQWMSYIICKNDLSLKVKLFVIISLPYILNLVFNTHPTLYYDKPALLLQLLLFLELIRLHQVIRDRGKDLARYIVILPVIALLGFSFKPIGALSVLFVCMLLLYLIVFQFSLVFKGRKKILYMMTVILCVSLLSGHLARNVMTTGWVLFPAPVGQLDTEWSMPEKPVGNGHWYEMQSVEGQYNIIKGWARLPGAKHKKAIGNGFKSWFPAWYKKFIHETEFWLLITGIVLTLFYLLLYFAFYKKNKYSRYHLFLITVSLSNILFWFFGAPDLRFGDGFIWIFFSLSIFLILSLKKIPDRVYYAIMVMLFVCLCYVNEIKIYDGRVDSLFSVGKVSLKKTKVIKIHNNQDVQLYVHYPKNDDRCGDSALPCTPYPLKNLMQRTPGVIADGFYYEY